MSRDANRPITAVHVVSFLTSTPESETSEAHFKLLMRHWRLFVASVNNASKILCERTRWGGVNIVWTNMDSRSPSFHFNAASLCLRRSTLTLEAAASSWTDAASSLMFEFPSLFSCCGFFLSSCVKPSGAFCFLRVTHFFASVWLPAWKCCWRGRNHPEKKHTTLCKPDSIPSNAPGIRAACVTQEGTTLLLLLKSDVFWGGLFF